MVIFNHFHYSSISPVVAALRYITTQLNTNKKPPSAAHSLEPREINSPNRTWTPLNTLKKQSRCTSEHAQDLNKSEDADKSSCYLYSVSIPSVQGFVCLWVNHKLGYYINSTKKNTHLCCVIFFPKLDNYIWQEKNTHFLDIKLTLVRVNLP